MSTGQNILSPFRRFIESGLAGCVFTLLFSLGFLVLYKQPTVPALQFAGNADALMLTFACVLFFLAFASLFAYAARVLGLDLFAACVLAAGILYFSLWLHFQSNDAYTNDVTGHWNYLGHMAHRWYAPYEYTGWEHWHPPLYYFIAGMFTRCVSALNFIAPSTAPRFLSLILYSIFCLYGLRTLQAAGVVQKNIYRVACLLIVFWPVGMIMATRINNDIAVYAVWSVFFYYLLGWWNTKSMTCMRAALVALSIAFMIKSNAVILLAMTGLCLLYALVVRMWTWQQWWSRKNIMAALFLCVGFAVNAGRFIHDALRGANALDTPHFGGSADDPITLAWFTRFDPLHFIAQPFNVWGDTNNFWNYFFKTTMYGEFAWPLFRLGSILNIALLVMIAIAILGNIRRQDGRAKFMMLTGIALPLLFIMAFAYDKKWVVAQDFRFVLPMLVPFTILFCGALERCRTSRMLRPLYAAGMSAACVFTMGGVVFYLGEYFL